MEAIKMMKQLLNLYNFNGENKHHVIVLIIQGILYEFGIKFVSSIIRLLIGVQSHR